MYKVEMKDIEVTTSSNRGINKERTVARYFGIERTTHDSTPYDKGSDIEYMDMKISVKSPKASLMSGNYTNGCHTFEGVWRRYRKNTHSNVFVFVTHDFTAYFMDINEFSKFVHKFAYLGHESSSKGGGIKIQFRDNKEMKKYLDKKCA